ncbi:MAG: hypothetical protein EB075_09250, partial [Bacteroidetes bacterium]|nr:hypothetical protein [Bacteroidota bacterium]
EICRSCGLVEEIKWRVPCFTHGGKNVAIVNGFSDACVLSFFKGVLLDDPLGLLEKPGPNTRSARIIRFTSTSRIEACRPEIIRLLKQAIENETKGLKVDFAKDRDMDRPSELTAIFERDPLFEAAFDQLTPGRQRGYLIHFTGAKQSATRTNRIQKARDRILVGKGLNDYP